MGGRRVLFELGIGRLGLKFGAVYNARWIRETVLSRVGVCAGTKDGVGKGMGTGMVGGGVRWAVGRRASGLGIMGRVERRIARAPSGVRGT